MKQLTAIEMIKKIKPFIGLDCEHLIQDVFRLTHPIFTHLVFKLTRYCNSENKNKATQNTLNFVGLWNFVCSLDTDNTDIFNSYFEDKESKATICTYYEIKTGQSSYTGKNGKYDFETATEAKEVATEFKTNPKSHNAKMRDENVAYWSSLTYTIVKKTIETEEITEV